MVMTNLSILIHHRVVNLPCVVSTGHESPPKRIIEHPRIHKYKSFQNLQVRLKSINFPLTRLLPQKNK